MTTLKRNCLLLILVMALSGRAFAQSGGVSIDALEKLSENQLDNCRQIRERSSDVKSAIAEIIQEKGVTMPDKSAVAVIRFTLAEDESRFRADSCCQCCVNGNYCCGPCDDNCCDYSVSLQNGETKVACCGGSDTVSLEAMEKIDPQHLADCRMLSKNRDAIITAINEKLSANSIKTKDGKQLYIRSFTVCRSPVSAEKQLARESCCQCCVNGNYCCGPCDDNCCDYN